MKGRYEKGESSKHVFSNGFVGKNGMQGEAIINFYYEFLELPTEYDINSIEEDNYEIVDKFNSEHQFVREFVSTVILTPSTALELRDWINRFLEEKSEEDDEDE